MASLRDGEITVRVQFANRYALEAFLRARNIVGEAAEELPWRDDLKEAAYLLKRAGRGIRLKGED